MGERIEEQFFFSLCPGPGVPFDSVRPPLPGYLITAHHLYVSLMRPGTNLILRSAAGSNLGRRQIWCGIKSGTG